MPSWPKNKPNGLSTPNRCDGDVHVAGACPLRVCDALDWAREAFVTAGVDTPQLDAELLLSHVLACSRVGLRTRWHDGLPASVSATFGELVRRRSLREPLAYLLQERPFYDVVLAVTPAVLVPRPETEHLVDAALAWARRHADRVLRVVDVGTGSGAIAIVLARHLPTAEVVAVDLSPDALAVARRNAERLDMGESITFVQSDLLDAVDGAFDIIAANLPYVDRDELPALMPEVSCYEPRLALDGGVGGLQVVSRLIAVLPQRLAPKGLALLELDPRQAQTAVALARAALPKAAISMIRDYAGYERVLVIERVEEEV